jgi:hypothetical protein
MFILLINIEIKIILIILPPLLLFLCPHHHYHPQAPRLVAMGLAIRFNYVYYLGEFFLIISFIKYFLGLDWSKWTLIDFVCVPYVDVNPSPTLENYINSVLRKLVRRRAMTSFLGLLPRRSLCYLLLFLSY